MIENLMFSIIVAIYKAESYLEKCICSILTQSYTNFELILVNDGSPDKSKEICEKYALKDKRIKVISQENGGQTLARNNGIRVSKGQYICFVDSDDWVEKNWLEEVYQTIENDSPDIVCYKYIQEYSDKSVLVADGREVGLYTKKKLQEKIYPRMFYDASKPYYTFGVRPVLWNKVYKRKLIFENQLNVDPRIRIGEDAVCVYPCFLEANRIYFLQLALYHYRVNANSITKTFDRECLKKTRILDENMNEVINTNIHYIGEQLNSYLVYMYLCAITNECRIPDS